MLYNQLNNLRFEGLLDLKHLWMLNSYYYLDNIKLLGLLNLKHLMSLNNYSYNSLFLQAFKSFVNVVDRGRTCSQSIKSRLLFHLSYNHFFKPQAWLFRNQLSSGLPKLFAYSCSFVVTIAFKCRSNSCFRKTCSFYSQAAVQW